MATVTNEDENLQLQKVHEPRHYQMELLEYLKERNGIIYLPTGAGKTYIAILAIKRYSHEMENTIENGGKRAIFMCNTIALARQQAVALKKHTNLKIGFYVGERDVDSWKKSKWQEEIDEHQVLVGTAQIFLDIVRMKYIRVTDLSVVVVDECHHATKQHPMHEFMGLFQLEDQARLPRVIGLTGVLLKGGKLSNVTKDLENLEATFRGNIITVSSIEQYNNVLVYSTNPKEELIPYLPDTHTFDIVNRIINEVEQCKAIVKEFDIGVVQPKLTKGLSLLRDPNKKKYIANLFDDFVYQMKDLGIYAATVAIMSLIMDFEIKKRQSETLALRNLYRLCITKCEYIRHLLMNKLKDLLDVDDVDDVACHTLDIIYNYSSSKLRSLLLYMKSKFTGKKSKDICCLLFVDRRYTAKCLYFVLKKFIELSPELVDIVKPDFMVGRNSILPGIESVLDNKTNTSSLEKFNSGECNMIICSSVLEEGIDVQSCNFVFAFDPLKTFSSYIQTKGRARSSESIYTIFTPKIDQDKTVAKIMLYKQTHEIILNFLIGRILDRDDPKDDCVAAQFDNLIPPFRSRSGALLLASSALATLHRYCMMLPMDAFGGVLPWFAKEPSVKDYVVSLKLPLQSLLKETILSDPMKNSKVAKISAAYKACIKLYELGELNERLLPVSRRECVAKVSESLFQHWKKHNDDVTKGKPGKQLRRIYERMCPEELYDAMPRVGEPCYIYELQFTTRFELNDYNKHIKDLMATQSNYALLLRKRLPRLAEMPLFMNQGELNLKIIERPQTYIIENAKQLEQLKNHHLMLFRELLGTWKSFFVFDQRNKQNSYLLVPVTNGKINWQLVENFQHLSPQRKYSPNERAKQVHRPEDYLGKVVNKWYSHMGADRYVVTKVCTDMTALSPFDNSGQYRSFAHFAESKYGSEIVRVMQPNQFLIEVKQLTSRRNFFINAIGKNANVNRRVDTILLIPELCHNFMYPGDLWLKAYFLPSILHRLHFMLHADTLRRRINDYLNISTPKTYEPKSLVIDASLKRAVDYDGNAMEEQEEIKKKFAPVPTKQLETHFEILTLNELSWKEYLEPCNLVRKIDSIYPVELDYYYKFISGLATDLDALHLQQEEEWTSSQLNMPRAIASATNHLQSLCITDTPLETKRHIEILARSLEDKNAVGMRHLGTAEQREFLAAITTAGANDVFDMERFELLGDSFLKFSVSLYLMNKFPNWHEGYLTEIKSKLVSNRNLLYCVLESDIPQRICGTLFKPNNEWLPPLVSLPRNALDLLEQNVDVLGSLSPGDLYAITLSDAEVMSGVCAPSLLERLQLACVKQQELLASGVTLSMDGDMHTYAYKEVLADKVVADTLEALLGVCVKNYGIYRTFRMLEFFGVCRPDADKPLTQLLDLNLGSPLLRTNISAKEIDGFLINHDKLEENLGYKFRDRAYLLQALTHPSYPTNRLTGCYQQLEFIGDAILDFLVSCYIFERHTQMTPGMLTDLRSALVNNITLGCVCVRHRFHLFLLAENSFLSESISKFASYQETQSHRVTDQVYILMEEEESARTSSDTARYNMSMNIEVPKTLGDIVEALIGAVYLDSRDLTKTWHVIYNLLEPEFNEFSRSVPKDPVRYLYEHKFADPKFSDPVIDSDVVMVKCVFTCLDKSVEVNGFGVNSKQAKKSAAKHALQILSKHGN